MTTDLDSSAKNPTVVKANSLVQAGYRLSIAEQRLLLSAIAQVDSKGCLSDQELYSVTAADFAEYSGIPIKQSYEELSAAAHRLYRREVRIERGPNGRDDGPHGGVTMTRWVQTVTYIEQEGRVAMRFGSDIVPYLSEIHREFTCYELRHVATMKSTYGVRLYELLMQRHDFGQRQIEISELRRMMGVPDGSYKAIKDLKKCVIEPAVRDVNQCSDLTVSWSQAKTGRRITSITFHFEPDEKAISRALDHKRQQQKSSRKRSQAQGKKNGRPYTIQDIDRLQLGKRGESYAETLARLNQKELPL